MIDGNIYYAKSLRISIINWWHVLALYLPAVAYTLLLIGVARLLQLFHAQALTWDDLVAAKDVAVTHLLTYWITYALVSIALALVVTRRKRSVYLLDFATYKPPVEWQVSHDKIMQLMHKIGRFNDDSLAFMQRILERSATGQKTHWPPSIIKMLEAPEGTPYVPTVAEARYESETVICGCLRELLDRLQLNPRRIDFLIVNCSLFSPTPSLTAMVANRFNLRPDVRSYNLSGMGCSAGVIAIDLAKQLLTNRPNSIAVVVSTENLTQNLYLGNERSMLLQNTLFRVGGAAIALSSHISHGFNAKYKLLHTVRTQNTQDAAYGCVYEQEDPKGFRGIHLSKDITKIAGKALTANLTILGPEILTLREQGKVLLSMVARRVTKLLKAWGEKNNWKWGQRIAVTNHYVPDFKTAIDHFCIHAGGRAVIDGIEKNLNLLPQHTEPSKATLRDFGNTSSSSIWYEMEHIEKYGRIMTGDRVLQIAFGSGFKCNSAVWLRLKR